jgi:phosphoglycolate phosphatase-like HAD superfamily hydrolase
MKLFVWDFHGVLEQGNDDAVLEITNNALEIHQLSRRMSLAESRQLSGLRWHEYFNYLLPEISLEDCLNLQLTCYEITQKNPEIIAKYIRPNKHVDSVLEQINKTGNQQILISNSHPTALDLFVEMVGVQKYFPKDFRFGVDSHTQKKFTKKDCLLNFLNKKSYKNIISIGDSKGDMDLIEDMSIGIGYSYCHPEKERRFSTKHHEINDLRQVLKEIY